MASKWAGLPEYPIIKHVEGMRFVGRRRDAVVELDATPVVDARGEIDKLAPVALAEGMSTLRRATHLGRLLQDARGEAAAAVKELPHPAPPPKDASDRRALAAYARSVEDAMRRHEANRAARRRAEVVTTEGVVVDGGDKDEVIYVPVNDDKADVNVNDESDTDVISVGDGVNEDADVISVNDDVNVKVGDDGSDGDSVLDVEECAAARKPPKDDIIRIALRRDPTRDVPRGLARRPRLDVCKWAAAGP